MVHPAGGFGRRLTTTSPRGAAIPPSEFSERVVTPYEEVIRTVTAVLAAGLEKG